MIHINQKETSAACVGKHFVFFLGKEDDFIKKNINTNGYRKGKRTTVRFLVEMAHEEHKASEKSRRLQWPSR